MAAFIEGRRCLNCGRKMVRENPPGVHKVPLCCGEGCEYNVDRNHEITERWFKAPRLGKVQAVKNLLLKEVIDKGVYKKHHALLTKKRTNESKTLPWFEIACLYTYRGVIGIAQLFPKTFDPDNINDDVIENVDWDIVSIKRGVAIIIEHESAGVNKYADLLELVPASLRAYVEPIHEELKHQ